MADVFSPEERSRIMAAVKGKNTKPELLVRSLVHRMGYRFRLHDSTLPGKPDIVLRRHKKIILVHGCFWHQHPDCQRSARPTSNVDYWNKKLDRNMERDRKNQDTLTQLGWAVLVLWECEIENKNLLFRRLEGFLSN